jgi:hypothetical protein
LVAATTGSNKSLIVCCRLSPDLILFERNRMRIGFVKCVEHSFQRLINADGKQNISTAAEMEFSFVYQNIRASINAYFDLQRSDFLRVGKLARRVGVV